MGEEEPRAPGLKVFEGKQIRQNSQTTDTEIQPWYHQARDQYSSRTREEKGHATRVVVVGDRRGWGVEGGEEGVEGGGGD